MYSNVPVQGGLVDRSGAVVAGAWQNALEGACWKTSFKFSVISGTENAVAGTWQNALEGACCKTSFNFSVISGTENADGIAGSVGRKGNTTEGWLHAHAEATAAARLEKQPVLFLECWC